MTLVNFLHHFNKSATKICLLLLLFFLFHSPALACDSCSFSNQSEHNPSEYWCTNGNSGPINRCYSCPGRDECDRNSCYVEGTEICDPSCVWAPNKYTRELDQSCPTCSGIDLPSCVDLGDSFTAYVLEETNANAGVVIPYWNPRTESPPDPFPSGEEYQYGDWLSRIYADPERFENGDVIRVQSYLRVDTTRSGGAVNTGRWFKWCEGGDVLVGCNHIPTCSIVDGPIEVLVDSKVTYKSTTVDPEGDQTHCDWSSESGEFISESCLDSVYTTPSSSGIEGLTFSSNDGQGNVCTTDSYLIRTYECDSLVFPVLDTTGQPRAVKNESYFVDINYNGPDSPPAFTYDANSSPTPSCGWINTPHSNPFSWTAPDSEGSICDLGGTIYIDESGPNQTADSCENLSVRVNTVPSCGDGISVSANTPINSCFGPIQAQVTNIVDPDPGDLSNLSFTWKDNCGGAFDYSNGDNPVSWTPPQKNVECNLYVEIDDGFESNTWCEPLTVEVDTFYSIKINVNTTEFGTCPPNGDFASGVTLTLASEDGLYEKKLTDGSLNDIDTDPGSVTFEHILTDTTKFSTKVDYSNVCTPFSLECHGPNGLLAASGKSVDIDVVPTICGASNYTIGVKEDTVSPWTSIIDGDVYAREVNLNAPCSKQELGCGFDHETPYSFSGSAFNYSELLGDNLKDTFSLSGTSSNIKSQCDTDPDVESCGKAENLGAMSTWYKDFDFDIPSHKHVYEIGSISDIDTPGIVTSISAENFNNDFDGDAENSSVAYNFGSGVSLLYVEKGEKELQISGPILALGSGRIILISDADINIHPTVGYNGYCGSDGYSVVASPNIQMGVITKGLLKVESAGDTNDDGIVDDLPIMIQGPLITNDLLFSRDIGLDNDLFPAQSVKYQKEYLAYLTQLDRTACVYSYTGLGVTDLRFVYGD